MTRPLLSVSLFLRKKEETPWPARAFTLIELLVTVAIIALLIAILLPSLGAARAQSHVTACASNLRQVGLALNTYAEDNAGRYPYADLTQANVFCISWDDLLNPFVGGSYTDIDMRANFAPKSMKLFICPEDTIRRVWTVPNAPRSYAIVRTLGGGGLMPGVYMPNFGGISCDVYYDSTPPNLQFNLSVRTVDVPQPDATLTVAEGVTLYNAQGRFENDCLDRPGDQSPLDDSTWHSTTGYWPAGRISKTLHGSKWNYLFADTHVEFIPPASTVGTGNMTIPKGMWTRATGD